MSRPGFNPEGKYSFCDPRFQTDPSDPHSVSVFWSRFSVSRSRRDVRSMSFSVTIARSPRTKVQHSHTTTLRSLNRVPANNYNALQCDARAKLHGGEYEGGDTGLLVQVLHSTQPTTRGAWNLVTGLPRHRNRCGRRRFSRLDSIWGRIKRLQNGSLGLGRQHCSRELAQHDELTGPPRPVTHQVDLNELR